MMLINILYFIPFQQNILEQNKCIYYIHSTKVKLIEIVTWYFTIMWSKLYTKEFTWNVNEFGTTEILG